MKTEAINIAKSHPKTLIIGGVVLVAAAWIGMGVLNYKRRQRDQKAVAFFSELQRELAPGSVGLVESNAFNIRYWEETGKKLKKPMYLLKMASAKAFAKDIRDSWSIFGDDEDKIYGVFRALKDQAQVSQVANQYYNDPKGDKINLIDDLNSRLSKDEVGQILGIVKKMPPYRLAEPPKPIKT